MNTIATETVDFVFEHEQHLWSNRDGSRSWTGRHGGFNSEDEAREGIRRFLRNWPSQVDPQWRDYPPKRFRITRVEVHTRHLAIFDADELTESTEETHDDAR